ncbi:MAG: hypothetical protein QXP36_00075 [Conexivisphaerales archaeon]
MIDEIVKEYSLYETLIKVNKLGEANVSLDKLTNLYNKYTVSNLSKERAIQNVRCILGKGIEPVLGKNEDEIYEEIYQKVRQNANIVIKETPPEELVNLYSKLLFNKAIGKIDTTVEQQYLQVFNIYFPEYKVTSIDQAYFLSKQLFGIDESRVLYYYRQLQDQAKVISQVRHSIQSYVNQVINIASNQFSENQAVGSEEFNFTTKLIADAVVSSGLLALANKNAFYKKLYPFYIQHLEKETVLKYSINAPEVVKKQIINEQASIKQQIENVYYKFWGKRKDADSVLKDFEQTLIRNGVDVARLRSTVALQYSMTLKTPISQAPIQIKPVVSDFSKSFASGQNILSQQIKSILGGVGSVAKKGLDIYVRSPSKEKKLVESDFSLSSYIHKEQESLKKAVLGVERGTKVVKTIRAIPQTIKNIVDIIRQGKVISTLATMIVNGISSLLVTVGIPVLITIVIAGIIVVLFPALMYMGMTNLASEMSLGDIYAYVTKVDAYVSSYIADSLTNPDIPESYLKPPIIADPLYSDWQEKNPEKFSLVLDKIPIFDQFNSPDAFTDPNVLISYLSALYPDTYQYPYFKDSTGQVIDVRDMIMPFTKGSLVGHTNLTYTYPDNSKKTTGNTDDFLYQVNISYKEYSMFKALYDLSEPVIKKYQELSKINLSLPEYKVRYYLGFDNSYPSVLDKKKELDTAFNDKDIFVKMLDTFNQSVIQMYDDTIDTLNTILSNVQSIEKDVQTMQYVKGITISSTDVGCECITCEQWEWDPVSGTYICKNWLTSNVVKKVYSLNLPPMPPLNTSLEQQIKDYINQVSSSKNAYISLYNQTRQELQNAKYIQTAPGKVKDATVSELIINSLTTLDKFTESAIKQIFPLYKLYFTTLPDYEKTLSNFVKPYLNDKPPNFSVSLNSYCNTCSDTATFSPADANATYGGMFTTAQSDMSDKMSTVSNIVNKGKNTADKIKNSYRVLDTVFSTNMTMDSEYKSITAQDLDASMQDVANEIIQKTQGSVLANYIIKKVLKDSPDKLDAMLNVYTPYGFLLKKELSYPDENFYINHGLVLYHRYGYFFDTIALQRNPIPDESVGPTNDFIEPPQDIDPKGFFSTGQSTVFNLLGWQIKESGFINNPSSWINRTILYKGVVLVAPDFFDEHPSQRFSVYAMLDGDLVYSTKDNRTEVLITQTYQTSEKNRNLNAYLRLIGDFYIDAKYTGASDLEHTVKVGSGDRISYNGASILYVEYQKIEPVYGDFLGRLTETDVYTYKNPFSYIYWEGTDE